MLAAAARLRRHPAWVFAAGAAAIALVSRAVVTSARFTAHPGPLAFAVTLDLSLTMAAWYGLTLVRARAAPPLGAVAVFFAGLAAAQALLPPGARGLASRLALLAGPAEALLLVTLARRALRIGRALRARGADVAFEDALGAAAREALGPYRAVDALASEATALGFAALSWRSAPHVPRGTTPFAVHARSGAGAVAVAVACMGAAETLAAHVLLAHWSSRAAWVATALSLYSAAWLVGDWRALALRPVLLGARELEVRIGLRWRATVPLTAIRRVCPGPDPRSHPGALRASPLGPPNLYLHLADAVELRGPFGIRRRGDCVGLRVDDAEGLARALAAREAPPPVTT